jgi:hypothetical protein
VSHPFTALSPQALGTPQNRGNSSRREALRCLKRHLARRVWHILQPDIDPIAAHATTPVTIHCNPPSSRFSLTYRDENLSG